MRRILASALFVAGLLGAQNIQPRQIKVPNTDVIVGGSGGLGAAVAVSGDCTLANTGAITCTTAGGLIPVTAVSAASAANKVCVATGATRTCSYIDFPDAKIIPAANCVAGTAGGGWSYATSTFTAACVAGSNNLGGSLQSKPSDGTGVAQFLFELPLDWDTASQPYVKVFYGSGANTSGTVIWTISTACSKEDGSVTDDPAFHAESAFGTQTMAAASRMWAQSAQLTAVTSGNNCIGGSTMIVKVALTGTASAVINAYQAVVTVPRLLTVQGE